MCERKSGGHVTKIKKTGSRNLCGSDMKLIKNWIETQESRFSKSNVWRLPVIGCLLSWKRATFQLFSLFCWTLNVLHRVLTSTFVSNFAFFDTENTWANVQVQHGGGVTPLRDLCGGGAAGTDGGILNRLVSLEDVIYYKLKALGLQWRWRHLQKARGLHQLGFETEKHLLKIQLLRKIKTFSTYTGGGAKCWVGGAPGSRATRGRAFEVWVAVGPGEGDPCRAALRGGGHQGEGIVQ